MSNNKPCNSCQETNTEICDDSTYTGCVHLDQDVGGPLNLEAGDDLNVALNKIKALIANLSPASYGNFNYACFASQGIDSEQKFVEFVSSILCQIVGAQTPGNITSLSQLQSLIQNLTTEIGGVKNQAVISCFQTLASLPANVPVNQLLTALQQTLCDLSAAVAGASSPNIIVNNTNKSVQITSSGTQGHALSAELNIKNDPDNALTKDANGQVFVPKETSIQVSSDGTIDVQASGTANHTLLIKAKIANTPGNQLQNNGSGLFVPAPTQSETPITAQDTDTVDLTASGQSNHTIKADVKIDPSPDNLLVKTASGLKVASGSIPSGSQTPITPQNTQSIQITASGLNNHTISANVKINPGATNPIMIAANGLDFDDLKAVNRIVGNPTALGILCGALQNCSLPTVTLNCSGVNSLSFNEGTGSTQNLIIPVSVTGSGTISVMVVGSGLSGSANVAVNPSTTQITIPLTFDGSSPAGPRTVNVNVVGTTSPVSCAVNVNIIGTPALFEISNVSNGPGNTRVQIFRVGPSVSPGNRFRLVVYSHIIEVVAIAGDTANSIAAKLRSAINNTPALQWDDNGQAPAPGTPGFPPTAISAVSDIEITLDDAHQFTGTAFIS